ncbi:MAG: YbaN family protein [Pseudomonadales bacterium]
MKPPAPPAPEPPTRRSLPHLILAYLCIGLGIIGAFLPLLPTTPFVLVAAWAAAKGSPKLHHWLYQHPRLGAPLIAWEQKRAVPTGAKWLACCFMAISWIIMYSQTSGPVIPTITGLLFISVATFLITRPAP